jgi:hypothetical protein
MPPRLSLPCASKCPQAAGFPQCGTGSNATNIDWHRKTPRDHCTDSRIKIGSHSQSVDPLLGIVIAKPRWEVGKWIPKYWLDLKCC